MGNGDIKKLVLIYLVEVEIFAKEDLERVALSGEQSLELRKLEHQERDKALQLKLKELVVREKELALEYTKPKSWSCIMQKLVLSMFLRYLLMWENTSISYPYFKSLRWINILCILKKGCY